MPFAVLEEEFTSRCPATGNALSCEPSGIIAHEARVGSTLAANMLAVLPYTLVYAESSVPYDLAGDALALLDPADAVRVWRVIIAAFGRPIVAAAAKAAPGRFPSQSTPDRFFLKLQVRALRGRQGRGGGPLLYCTVPALPPLLSRRCWPRAALRT